MLQRINFGLMIVVLLAVVGVSVQMFMTQRSHHKTLETITTELTALRTAMSERPVVAPAPAEYEENDETTDGLDDIADPPAGTWLQVDEAGRKLPSGLAIEVFDRDDVRSLQRSPTVHLDANGLDGPLSGVLAITLQADGSARISSTRQIGRRLGPLVSAWQLRNDGTLVLNLASAIPKVNEPVLFRHSDDLDDVYALAAAKRDDGDEVRILIEGDIERPGWYPIQLDEITYLHEMVRRVNAHEQQWILHRRPDSERLRFILAEIHLGEEPPRTVIRPGDEIFIRNSVSAQQSTAFAWSRREQYLDPYEWREVDENGNAVEGGWRIRFGREHIGPESYDWVDGWLTHLERSATFPIRNRSSNRLSVALDDDGNVHSTLHWSFNVDTLTVEAQAPSPHTPDKARRKIEAADIPDKITLARLEIP